MKNFVIGLIFSAFVVSNTAAQEITTAENFLQTAMPAKTVTKTFSYDLRDEFYTRVYCDKYLAVTNVRKKLVSKPKGYRESKVPTEIDIFDSKGRIIVLALEHEKNRVDGFIKDSIDYFIFEKPLENKVGIYKMDGTFVKSLTGFNFVSVSPGGKYFYHKGPDNQLGIFYADGRERFFITSTLTDDLFNQAASDSTLLSYDCLSLSLWNVDTQQKLWESKVPVEHIFGIGSINISYSHSADIIVIGEGYSCCCFNFKGDYLWSKDDFNIYTNKIIMTKALEKNGMVVISSVRFQERNVIKTDMFSRDGDLLRELKINLGSSCSFSAGGGDFAGDVFSEYVIIRFTADIGTGNKHVPVTAIIHHDGKDWHSAVVDGYWYLLDSESEVKTLIGFDSKSNAVSAYSIE